MGHGGKRPGAGRPRKVNNEVLSDKTIEKPPLKNSQFTEEERKILEASPYIRKVSASTVSYTTEFKELFWSLYNQGMSPVDILRQLDIDIEILGNTRVYGILTSLRKTKEKGLEFTDGRTPIDPIKRESKPKLPRFPPGRKPMTAEMNPIEFRKLQHEVMFLTQEIEFLKKIIHAKIGEESK